VDQFAFDVLLIFSLVKIFIQNISEDGLCISLDFVKLTINKQCVPVN